MNKLYIIGSPRKEMSKSNLLGDYVDNIISGDTTKVDLFENFVPFINSNIIAYNYGFMKYEELSDEDKKVADTQKQYIDQLLNAEVLIISAPMWNFSMPAILKAWFDLIIKVNVTFSMDQNGYHGLVTNIKKAIIVGWRGWKYQGTPAEGYDMLTPQIKGLLGFIGINNVETFWLEGVNMDKDQLESNTNELKGKLQSYALA